MKGLRGHSKPKALMFLFATPERENKGTSSSSPCVMPWLLEAWHVTPGCQAPNRMGEHPMEGMPSGKKPCLTAGGRSERILPLLHVENIPGYSEEQQAAGYRAALLRSSTWGLCWQCLASP